MIDELAGAKAYYAMKFQESQNVLQQMLNERHELRRNLFQTHRYCMSFPRSIIWILKKHEFQFSLGYILDLLYSKGSSHFYFKTGNLYVHDV